MTRNTLMMIALACLAPLFVVGACDEDETLDAQPTCPNERPEPGSRCPLEGMVCNYFTGCEQFYPTTCQPGLTWSVVDECVPPIGGAGGTAGAGGGAGGQGAAGGGGGAGGLGGGGFGGLGAFGGSAGGGAF